jgi:hypothetical protein
LELTARSWTPCGPYSPWRAFILPAYAFAVGHRFDEKITTIAVRSVKLDMP